MAPAKIVVVGDVNGQFPVFFAKLAALHSKNAFSLALVVGNLFADPRTVDDDDEKNERALVEGRIQVPLPVYFALGTHALPQPAIDKLEISDGELCPNLYFLGKRTTTKTSEGIRIVALGGALVPQSVDTSENKYGPVYSEADAKILRGANNADILITSQWPEEIWTGSKNAPDASARPPSHQCVADLCAKLRPRYHITTSPTAFYEREPFFHPQAEEASDTFNITRFISLAAFGNTAKQKWVYAFSLDPTAALPITLPPGTTTCPPTFREKKRPALPDQNSYRFAETGVSAGSGLRNKRQRGAHRGGTRNGPPSQTDCFFCLSNENVATHIITSIGTDAYMTNAKGPLTKSDTFPSLNFPAHALIIPMAHSPTLSSISDEETRISTIAEMHKYRMAMQKMLNSKSKGALGAVTWELSRAGGFHTHWQFVPVPGDLIKRGLVEAAFKVEAENNQYPSFENGEPDDSTDWVSLCIWNPEADEAAFLWMPIEPSFRDVQYPRRVLAKLLEDPGRANWQNCVQNYEDEEAEAEAFKAAFKEFDFTEDGVTSLVE